MIRLILFCQMAFFAAVGALISHQQIELATQKATFAVYREMPVKVLTEVKL